MHAAPPVRVALGRSPGWVAFVSGCAALAAAQVLAWTAMWLEWDPDATITAAALGALAAALAFGIWAWRAQPPGDLAFDGAGWHWRHQPGRPRLAIDLQSWILLQFEPNGTDQRRVWIAASRRGAGPSWTALRAALYSPSADVAVDPAPPVTPPG